MSCDYNLTTSFGPSSTVNPFIYNGFHPGVVNLQIPKIPSTTLDLIRSDQVGPTVGNQEK